MGVPADRAALGFCFGRHHERFGWRYTKFDARSPKRDAKKFELVDQKIFLRDSHFGAHLKIDMSSMRRSFRVIDSLCTGLNVGIDAVEVRRGESIEVVQPVERDGVLRRSIGKCGRVAGHRALVEVVLCLGAEEEPISTKGSFSGECRTLCRLGSAEWLHACADME